MTAAMPLIIGDDVFVSACYGAGAVLARVTASGAEKVWANDESMSCHYATCVRNGDFLYGVHGRTDPGLGPGASLRCVEWATGKVRWSKDGFGAATMILAGDRLLILTERGELIRAQATPSGFKAEARAQVLSNQVRAHAALAEGRYYARSKDTLVCLDLRKPGKN